MNHALHPDRARRRRHARSATVSTPAPAWPPSAVLRAGLLLLPLLASRSTAPSPSAEPLPGALPIGEPFFDAPVWVLHAAERPCPGYGEAVAWLGDGSSALQRGCFVFHYDGALVALLAPGGEFAGIVRAPDDEAAGDSLGSAAARHPR